VNVILKALIVVAGLLLLVCGAGSCDKIKQIKGMVSGRVQTPEGGGVGYVSLSLVNLDTGGEVDRMTAEDSGSFIFRDVEAGNYTIKIYTMTGDLIPSEVEDFRLTPGRTINVDVIMTAGQTPE